MVVFLEFVVVLFEPKLGIALLEPIGEIQIVWRGGASRNQRAITIYGRTARLSRRMPLQKVFLS